MCGIIGYNGSEDVFPRLLTGLKSLEYRGYDSAGVAAVCDGAIATVKSVGRIAMLEEKLAAAPLSSRCGIGHTRWATHGEPSDRNAHPHSTKRLSLVHNGIIENYAEIKRALEERGYAFDSETDTEVAAKLLDCKLADGASPLDALRESLTELRGSFAFGILFACDPGHLYATRRGSPLIVSQAKDGCYIASDITAILRYTNEYFELREGEIAVLSDHDIVVWDEAQNPVEKTPAVATWDYTEAEKGGYPHFMLKEIHEEAQKMIDTARPRVNGGLPDLSETISDEALGRFRQIHIVACGTAMHAGLIGKAAIESLCRMPVSVEIASEFRYNNPILSDDDLVVVISQSGETADSLAALRLAKSRGVHTLAIVNVVGSSIAREADSVMITHAGPEIAVASTKAYMVQVVTMYLLALKLAVLHGRLEPARAASLLDELVATVPACVEQVIERGEHVRDVSGTLCGADDLFFIGRGMDYPLCLEGSLKLKEISYIHSEAYAAGELKHGTISLITDKTPVIALATCDALFEKMISNIKEVKARGARVILLCKAGAEVPRDGVDVVIRLPEVSELFMPLVGAAALQLIAYHTAVLRGCDVDKPRNLAKSVTVE